MMQEFIKKDKVIQHTAKGITRFLMLWIIMKSGSIHGYAILQQLDDFFDNLIQKESLKKSSPSRIYIILKDMENNGLIKSKEYIQNNQKIKLYEITECGEHLLYYIRDNYYEIMNNTRQGRLLDKFLNTTNH